MEQTNLTGPYAPPENIERVLTRVRQSGVRKLDISFLSQLGIHVAMAPRTIRALEFLGFTDKTGGPLPPLQEYYAAKSDDDAKAVLANAVQSSYDIIYRAVNPATESREKVEQAFRVMEPAGQRTRMVTLFLGLCRQAGLPVMEPPPSRPGTSRSVRPNGKQKPQSVSAGPPALQTPPVSQPRPTDVLFHPAVDAYLRAAKSLIDSDAWTKDARDRFVQGFETQLDLFLPVKN